MTETNSATAEAAAAKGAPEIPPESVLVVPRAFLDRLSPRTFSRETDQVTHSIIANASFMPRARAEHDFSFKQVIPYIVIQHENRFLLIRRTKKQTEARLHDMFSLGIGGHVNDEDAADGMAHVLERGLERELTEEIRLADSGTCHLAGIINDDSTEVARVHTGLVHILKTGSAEYEIMEPGKYTACWKTAGEMLSDYEQMESWAKIVFDFLIDGSPEREARWNKNA